MSITAAVLLTAVAVAHSLLGERVVLRPLLAQGWRIGIPRRHADGRYVGVLKRVRDTAFARADDRYWTPAVGLLAAGAAAGLALAG